MSLYAQARSEQWLLDNRRRSSRPTLGNIRKRRTLRRNVGNRWGLSVERLNMRTPEWGRVMTFGYIGERKRDSEADHASVEGRDHSGSIPRVFAIASVH